MTNAERFIGDEDEIDTFIDEFYEFACSRDIAFKYFSLKETLIEFFKSKVRTTLTEDERVILKSLKERYKYIGREGMLYIAEQEQNSDFVAQISFNEYKPNIFQFIKERRRIRDKGVAK